MKPFSLFVFSFALACERIFIKPHSAESRCVTGPENILFAGASLQHSARKCHRMGSEGVKSDVIPGLVIVGHTHALLASFCCRLLCLVFAFLFFCVHDCEGLSLLTPVQKEEQLKFLNSIHARIHTPPPLSYPRARAHTHTPPHTYTRMHARTVTHTHTHKGSPPPSHPHPNLNTHT